MNWKHKDIWTLRESNFTIEVSRHEEGIFDLGEGIHRWCVYAYIYPSHPLFKEFEGPSMFQEAASKPPFHWGSSYLKYHRDENGITSVQIGADYHHLHDARFTNYATMEDASEVFQDAHDLANFLTNYKANLILSEEKEGL